MKAQDFLDVADELAAGNREAEWRSGASRAYYAAFHVARQLLIVCGFAVPDGESCHGFVWLRIANAGQPQINNIGNGLRELRRLRNLADYNLDISFNQHEALGCVSRAIDYVRILEAAQTMAGIMTQIPATIRDYERDVLKQVSWKP